MARVMRECDECGGRLEVRFGGRWLRGEFHWSSSSHCQDCGSQVEADDSETPPEWRELELELDGTWSVRIAAADFSIVDALRAIRQGTGMSLQEASRLKASLPGPVLAGTRAEMDAVVHFLAGNGIGAEAVRQ